MKRLIPVLLLLLCPSFAQAGISRTGSVAATATSGTFSATATGDLKIVFAVNNGSTTVPTLPAGWTSIATIATSATGAVMAVNVGCNKSSSAGDTGTGTWTNATAVAGVSYSGTSVNTTGDCPTTGLTANGLDGNTECATASNCFAKTSTTVTYRAITTQSSGSWIVGFMGGSGSSLCTPPGMTQVTSSGVVDVSDTNATATSWAGATCSVTSETWIMFDIEITAASPACTGCTPAVIQSSANGEQWANPATFFSVNIPDPNGAKAGNMLVYACKQGSATAPILITDDKNNSWYSFTISDGVNGNLFKFGYAPNVAGGTRKVTATFSSSLDFNVCALYELTNIATANPVDVSETAQIANGTVAAGSMTTTVNGDLILQQAWCNSCGNATNTYTWAANGSFKLDNDNGFDVNAMQWEVQSTAGAVNPTLTLTAPGGGSISNVPTFAVAFKGASSGSSRTGMYVDAIKILGFPGTNLSSNPATIVFGAPTTGNLIEACTVFATANLPDGGISSSPAETWNGPFDVFATAGSTARMRCWYAINVTQPAPTRTISLSWVSNPRPGDSELHVFDVTGVGSFDATSPCSSSQNQGTNSGTFNGMLCTPTVAGELILGVQQSDFDTVSSASPGGQQAEWGGTYQANSGDKDSGQTSYIAPSTSAVQFTWTFNNTAGVNIGHWYDIGLMFLAPGGGSGGLGGKAGIGGKAGVGE